MATPSSTITNSLPYLPDDIITILATHVGYSRALALLSARPDNMGLIRALYNRHSDFWHQRLGIHTGHGGLVDLSTGLPTKRALWSLKDQHDALIPREGNLIASAPPGDIMNVPRGHLEGIYTTLRVRSVINYTTYLTAPGVQWVDEYPNSVTHVLLRYLIVTEDGDLRSLSRSVVVDNYWYDTIADVLEDTAAWRVPQFYPAPRPPHSTVYRPTTIGPRFKVLVECDEAAVGLDYDGRLWLVLWTGVVDTYQQPNPGPHDHDSRYARVVELVLPSSLLADGPVQSIVQIAWTSLPLTRERHTHIDSRLAILLTLEGNSQECILTLDVDIDSHDAIVPRITPIDRHTSALAHTWFYPTTHERADEPAPYAYPYAPRLILASDTGRFKVKVHRFAAKSGVTDKESTRHLSSRGEVDVFPADIIYHHGILDGYDTHDMRLTRVLESDARPVVVPLHDHHGAASDQDIEDAADELARAGIIIREQNAAIPILPLWVLGRMDQRWGEVMSRWYSVPSSPYSDIRGPDPYVWATVSSGYRRDMPPTASLMPNGAVYRLWTSEGRTPDVMGKSIIVNCDPEWKELGGNIVWFLQVGMGGMGRVYGVGVGVDYSDQREARRRNRAIASQSGCMVM